MNAFRAARPSAFIAALWALILCACLPMGDRLAGSSTEAGNAGGKLSLSDGKPAAGVSVALVARSYLPDTLGSAGVGGDVAGAYYRTRTNTDGSYSFPDVAPGSYRVMAIGEGGGVLADSVVVAPGGSARLAEHTLKPLGGIRGIAKIIGSKGDVNVWVRPKATLKAPPRADLEGGGFVLDSLPEGEYELVTQCFTCHPVKDGYHVRVKAGKDTVLSDTLKVYPEYFYDFPDSGDMDVRASWLPLTLGGKVNKGMDKDGKPGAIAWDWNGKPLQAQNVSLPDGISETHVVLDAALFGSRTEGALRVVLVYPDTNIVRSWRVRLNTADPIYPLSAIRSDSALKVSGPLPHLWRFRVADSRGLSAADVAFWGLKPKAPANASPLPGWLYLQLESAVEQQIVSGDPSRLTFILLPDAKMGGTVFRPRFDERLEDFGKIHFLERARFGFADTLEPSMLPEGLFVDRARGPYVRQRYQVDSLGGVRELLAPLPLPGASSGTPLLFYRYGAAADGFSWDKPLRDAAKALAVTREGLAVRLDGSGETVPLPGPEIDLLKELLAPLAQDPPGIPDTALPPDSGGMEYAWSGIRGLLAPSGKGNARDALMAALKEWMVRNGLEEAPRFPLQGPSWRFLAFTADSSGVRYTGDTLLVDLAQAGQEAKAREYLSPGSPGRALDSSVAEYGLKIDRDSLFAYPADGGAVSRLFGSIDMPQGLFVLTGLAPVAPEFQDGFPILSGNGNTLSGRLDRAVEIHGRTVGGALLWLDGRGIDRNRLGVGYIYTPGYGLERVWRFSGRDGGIRGWDRE
jgi:hypothetical protein